MMFFLKQVMAITLFLSVLSGCAVVPKFADEKIPKNCELFTRSIELDLIGANLSGGNSSNSCGGEACAAAFLVIAGVFVTSVIISSSIYVVGNTAHFLEKQGRCDDEGIIDDEVTAFSKKLESVGGKKIEPEKINAVIKEQTSNIR